MAPKTDLEQESILSMSMERDGEDDKNIENDEMMKVEDAINHSSLRKPTEYSASIDNQHGTTARPISDSEIEI